MSESECFGCGLSFKEGDTVYFRPIPFSAILDQGVQNVLVQPLCRKCICEYSIHRGTNMGEVIDITDRLKRKKEEKAVDSFKGRGFPEDYYPGPDELTEPLVPAHNPIVPEEVKAECPDWIRRVLDGKEEKGKEE